MTECTVALVAIGTELTRGEITNTNGSWLAERTTTLGMQVVSIETVADDPELIIECLKRCSARCRLIMVTGGLGPTTDDLTSATVAQLLGEGLVRHEGVVEALKERLERFKLDPTLLTGNLSQADFPQSAQLLANRHGTAPGFFVEYKGCRIACMPGVPREMKPMFEQSLVPWIAQQVVSSESLVRLRCFNAPESVVNSQLATIEEEFDVQIGYRAHFPEVEVKIFARGLNPAAVRARVDKAAERARQALGTAVYSEGHTSMAQVVAERLRKQGLTLAVAESCTGGLLSSLLTAEPCSDYFKGAVVSYANKVKSEVLSVPEDMLQSKGAVSDCVAEAMAVGVRQHLSADVGISVTGIAGPTGGTDQKPVGLIFVAVALHGGTQVQRIVVRPRERQQIQLFAAWSTLNLLRQTLADQEKLESTHKL